jgi:hypothetical protein
MKTKTKYHILWADITRDERGFVETSVRAACDTPTPKRRVEELRARFVRDFGWTRLETARFRDAESGKQVASAAVWRHCIKAVDRAARGQ